MDAIGTGATAVRGGILGRPPIPTKKNCFHSYHTYIFINRKYITMSKVEMERGTTTSEGPPTTDSPWWQHLDPPNRTVLWMALESDPKSRKATSQLPGHQNAFDRHFNTTSDFFMGNQK